MKILNCLYKVFWHSLLSAAILFVMSSCASQTNPPPSRTTATSTPAATVPTSKPSSSQPTTKTATSAIPAQTTTPTASAIPAITIPNALISSRATLNNTNYVVFAWNDLGMHCANPTYDKAVLLPPYNTVWAQVSSSIAQGRIPWVNGTGVR